MSKALSDFLNYFNQEQSRYPWQLTTESAETIAERVEDELSQEEEADLQERSNRFFMSLDTLLGEAQKDIVTQTIDTLLSRLEQWLPRQQCLDVVKICQAKRLAAEEYRDQLALAIAELLPQWNGDDRAILMRNYAGAFRSGNSNARSLKLSSEKDWDAMSAVEQGQYLVAIADMVLTELNEIDA